MKTRYYFEDKYVLFPVPDITGNLIRWYLQDKNSGLAMFCFTTVDGDVECLRKEISHINTYIMRYVHEVCRTNVTTPMVMHTDEAQNYTAIRVLWPCRKYEAVHVRHNGYGAAASFSHMVIDLSEYSDDDLDELVGMYGYKNLTCFLQENDAADAIIDGTVIDRNGKAWFNIAETLVAFIIESEDGRIMDFRRADKLAAAAGAPIPVED